MDLTQFLLYYFSFDLFFHSLMMWFVWWFCFLACSELFLGQVDKFILSFSVNSSVASKLFIQRMKRPQIETSYFRHVVSVLFTQLQV